MQLVDERGPIRLVVELAIAFGSIAVVASWGIGAAREGLRRRRAIAAVLDPAPRGDATPAVRDGVPPRRRTAHAQR